MISVKFAGDKLINDYRREFNQQIQQLGNDLLQILRTPTQAARGEYGSPVKSGKFKNSWRKTGSQGKWQITNKQPYAAKLDAGAPRGAESRWQAPQGVVKPSVQELIRRQQRQRRK